MAATLVLDTSASMSFPKAVSKYRYAMILSAALAHIVSSQGDAVGLVAGPRMIPARAGRHSLRALLAALSGVEASGKWNAAETVRRAAERLNRRGLLLVLSDFYDEEVATFNELTRAARMGHEVVLFQTMSREEVEFPYRRDFEFEDLETGRSVSVNAGLARREYTDAVAAFLERCRRRAGAEGFQYSLIVTDTPPAHGLRNFLLARQR